MDVTCEHERQMIIAEAWRFVDREVIPIAHELEASDTYPFELIDKLNSPVIANIRPIGLSI